MSCADAPVSRQLVALVIAADGRRGTDELLYLAPHLQAALGRDAGTCKLTVVGAPTVQFALARARRLKGGIVRFVVVPDSSARPVAAVAIQKLWGVRAPVCIKSTTVVDVRHRRVWGIVGRRDTISAAPGV